jgi:disulfide oxidoreductase YuzD
MTKKQNHQPVWLDLPQEHDYPAAESYLSLIFLPPKAAEIAEALHNANISHFKAKDIFRASGLSLLGISNSHVEKDREKIEKGTHLSPLLLVRSPELGKIIIADGYHRLCAVYGVDEDALIPCKIA